MPQTIIIQTRGGDRWKRMLAMLSRWRTVQEMATELGVDIKTVRRDVVRLSTTVQIDQWVGFRNLAYYRLRKPLGRAVATRPDSRAAERKVLRESNRLLAEVLERGKLPPDLRLKIEAAIAKPGRNQLPGR